MRQLSGTDTLMLMNDRPHAQNMICGLSIYDPSTAPGRSVTFDDVVALVASRLHVSDSFRERLVNVPLGLDRPWWIKDAAFDLEYHIRHIALPAPGTWRQLCTQVARLGARPIDLTRPPWEFYVIEGLDGIEGMPEGSFALMSKLHHAAVDGVSGTEMMTAIHDHSPEPPPVEPSPEWASEDRPSDLSLMSNAAAHALTRPLAFAGFVIPAVRRLPGALRNRRDRPPGSAPAMPAAARFNTAVSAHRSWGQRQFTLAELKTIRRAVDGAKVNDVALALVGGAMRRYLTDKGELPQDSLVALMPISVRPTTVQERRPDEVEASAGGNRFAMTNVTMATDVDDPLERLTVIAGVTAAAKLKSAVGAQTLSQMSELLPGGLLGSVQRAVTRTVNRRGRALGAHTLVTNVPGSQTPLYLCGARAVMMTGMPPIVDGMGLVNGVGSYNGNVNVCFTADRDMMPDPEFYEGCLQASFDELLHAATMATKVASTEKVAPTKAAPGKRVPPRRAAATGSARPTPNVPASEHTPSTARRA
jgi:diacylglycerol O-acyltransferase